MIFYIGVLLTGCLLLFAVFSPSYKYPLVAYILFCPIIDASWNYRLGNMSLIHIFNAAFILFFFLRLLIKKEKMYEFPYIKLFIVYFSIIIIVSIHFCMNSEIITALDFFLKSIIGPLAFYLFYRYFADYKSGKLLTTVLILSGIFPLFFAFLQKFTGIGVYRTSRGLIRSVGLYHDSATTRFFLMQLLIGILIYWYYFLKKEYRIKRIVLIILFFSAITGLYFTYSKTIIVTSIAWVLMFSFFRRRIYVLPLALVLILLINQFSGNRIYNEVNQVFSDETAFTRGETDIDQILSGRGSLWRRVTAYWGAQPLIVKIIGDGIHHGRTHNDFLRMLLSGGILLLCFYVFLTAIILGKIIYELREKRRFIHFIALLCIVYLFVESLGQTAGIYPSVQVVIWGVVGLSLNQRLEWIENSAKNKNKYDE